MPSKLGWAHIKGQFNLVFAIFAEFFVTSPGLFLLAGQNLTQQPEIHAKPTILVSLSDCFHFSSPGKWLPKKATFTTSTNCDSTRGAEFANVVLSYLHFRGPSMQERSTNLQLFGFSWSSRAFKTSIEVTINIDLRYTRKVHRKSQAH